MWVQGLLLLHGADPHGWDVFKAGLTWEAGELGHHCQTRLQCTEVAIFFFFFWSCWAKMSALPPQLFIQIVSFHASPWTDYIKQQN